MTRGLLCTSVESEGGTRAGRELGEPVTRHRCFVKVLWFLSVGFAPGLLGIRIRSQEPARVLPLAGMDVFSPLPATPDSGLVCNVKLNVRMIAQAGALAQMGTPLTPLRGVPVGTDYPAQDEGPRNGLEHGSCSNRLQLRSRFDMRCRDITHVLGVSVSSSTRRGGEFSARHSVVSLPSGDACLGVTHGPMRGSPGLAVITVTGHFSPLLKGTPG